MVYVSIAVLCWMVCAMMIMTIFEHGEVEKMKRCYRLNFDTLIIQYNAAIRKVQRLQDFVTDGLRTDRGIGDSGRLGK